ncbi:MAG TPA: hypothetical protein VNC84_06920 [Gammaproteobacteria bacterium]|jgi:hypothetical protein|nr:hypothetical protein [Gammaproteobacteria bacterium]
MHSRWSQKGTAPKSGSSSSSSEDKVSPLRKAIAKIVIILGLGLVLASAVLFSGLFAKVASIKAFGLVGAASAVSFATPLAAVATLGTLLLLTFIFAAILWGLNEKLIQPYFYPEETNTAYNKIIAYSTSFLRKSVDTPEPPSPPARPASLPVKPAAFLKSWPWQPPAGTSPLDKTNRSGVAEPRPRGSVTVL